MIDIEAERDAWLAIHPERTISVGGRRWGVIETPPAADPAFRLTEAPDAPPPDAPPPDAPPPDAPPPGAAPSAGRTPAGLDRDPHFDVSPTASGDRAPDPPPTLLLLPGSLGRADILWRMMTRLEGRARMISVTYPATHDIAVWCDDLVRMLDRAGAERASVFGASIGGFVAQHLAARRPDRIERLAVANTVASVGFLKDLPPYAGDPMTTPMTAVREGFGRGLQEWAARHPDQADIVALLLAETRGRIPARQMRARLMAMRHASPPPPQSLPAAAISLIEAVDDPLVDAALREELRASLRPGTVYRFLNAGHHGFLMRPELFAAAMAEGLGLDPPGAGLWGTGALRVR